MLYLQNSVQHNGWVLFFFFVIKIVTFQIFESRTQKIKMLKFLELQVHIDMYL
jgi:hypothetical protein